MTKKLYSLLFLALPMMTGCETTAGEQELLCNPGDFIFCRCEDGSAGTKQCSDDGLSTTECGNCQAAPGSGGGTGPYTGTGTGSGTYTGTGTGTDTSTGTGGLPEEHIPGAAAFLAPCTAPADCESGMCQFGYCTKECGKVSDCTFPTSECAEAGGVKVCMPACKKAEDCADYGGSSQCGFASASDNWKVTVCANWGPEHRLMPADTDCTPFDHTACNLGYSGRQAVCSEEGKCTVGCFYNSDCMGGSTCSTQGTLGTCN
jgi:hypothetical protein